MSNIFALIPIKTGKIENFYEKENTVKEELVTNFLNYF